MKKRKVELISILSVVVLMVLLAGGYLIRIPLEIGKFSPLGTQQLATDLFVVKDDYINVYNVKTNDQYLAIDAGKSGKNIIAGLKEFNLTPEDISVLLLTHTDSDHVNAAEIYKNAKVYISTSEETMINGKMSKQLGVKNKLTVPYALLPDHGTQEIGEWTVQTILLPGHTLGSVCYIINGQYLFTGDSIAIVDGKAVTFNDFFNMDSKQQEENIHQISQLENIELILITHYGMSDNYAALYSEWN